MCVQYTLNAVDSRAVIRRLQRDGWMLHSTRGSHQQFVHPTKPGRVTVKHPAKDLPVGTLRNIYRQAGWKWEGR